MKKIIVSFSAIVLATLGLLLGSITAQAAIIGLDPQDTIGAVGDIVDVDIVGTEFSGGTIGGGFTLSWDPSIVSLVSSSLTFPGDQFFGQGGAINPVLGTWTNADVTSLSGVAGPDFDVASIQFEIIGEGVSVLDLEIGLFAGGSERIWADESGFNDTAPSFVDGSIGTIPIPAAAWLFGSALFSLVMVGRKRKL